MKDKKSDMISPENLEYLIKNIKKTNAAITLFLTMAGLVIKYKAFGVICYTGSGDE